MSGRRTDTNHREVIDALRSVGWLVKDTHGLPGFVDAVAYHRGRQVLKMIEIKALKGGMTRLQILMREEGWPVVVVRTRDEALSL